MACLFLKLQLQNENLSKLGYFWATDNLLCPVLYIAKPSDGSDVTSSAAE